ncbi:phage tail tip fiber protein [Pedomonas sp. V897]|uniref:phage tail tip fiber protein n=1 Tax=Pedomonas sp. V897 TaxID=3446482 RepID=UPI003EDEF89A
MSKVVRTAATIVGAVALGAIGVGAIAAAAAGPGYVATSVAGVSMSTWTGLAAGAGLVSMATGLTAPKPSVSGSPTKFMADPQAPIPYAIGRTMNRGNIIYQKTHTSPGKVPNDRLTMVVILSGGGPVQEIEAFYANKALVSFSSAGAATGSFADYMWQRRQLGQCPEPAALSVSSGDGSPPPGWSSAHKLSGYAAAIWTLRWDSKGEKFPSGVPEPGWVGKWVKVYDPRLDSTYPGGSGPCRPLQESTYVWSRNPFLHGLTWCLGRWQNGKRVLGMGVPIDGIDVAAFVEGANVADANGWRAGGVVYSTDSKWQVLKQMLQAGGGEPIRQGAKISCIVNAPKVSLATVTTNDLAGECRVAATQSRRDRINAAIPRYRSEAHDWEIISADKIRVQQHIDEDGGERCREIDMPLVQVETGQSNAQPGQLARYAIENSREFGPIVLTLKPRWMGYRPGDCITVNLPELRLVNQACLVLTRSLDPQTGIVTLTCRSETAGKHAFALGQTATPPPTPGVASEPFPYLSWDLIPDPNGTKPEDNATVGGQFGVNIRDEFGNILTTDEIRKAIDKIGESQLLPELAKPITDGLIRSIIDIAHTDGQVFEQTRVSAKQTSEIRDVKVATDEGVYAITQLSSRLNEAGGPGVTMEQALSIQETAIGTLSASYTLRINNNGRVSGFGLASGAGGTSEFAILADRFVVADPANNEVTAYPFQVVDGQVYIRKAMIQKIQAGDMEVAELSAITAKIGLLRTASTGARLEIHDNVIKVFDENGNIRVKIGNLAL